MTKVQLKAQRCALPGCDEIIERADGQKARKYCCAAHRVISRQQRREAEEQNAYQAMVAQSRVLVSASQSAVTPAAAPVAGAESGEASDEQLDAKQVEPAAPIRPTKKSRRTSRAAARRAPEPAATTAENDDAAEDAEYDFVPLLVDLEAMDRAADRPAVDDGWDAVGNLGPTQTPSSPSSAKARRRTVPGPDAAARRAVAVSNGESREKGHKRRTQAIALLGAAGILAGGGGWVVSNANTPSDPRALVGTTGQPPSANAQEWVRQAKLSLASVSRQLDIVAQVEELWNRSPAAQNGGAPPAAVQAMLDRKAALEQQRATVQSWLAAVESVDAVSAQLAQTDAQLAAIDRALASSTSGPQTPQLAQLRAQRDFVKQQRDAKAAELEGLKSTVNQVVAQPLPDPASEQRTEELGQRVTNLASDPNAPEPGQENGRLVPMPAVAYRNNEGEFNHEPGTGAPPRPGRGSSDEQEPDPQGQDGAGHSGGVSNFADGQRHPDPASFNLAPTGRTAGGTGNNNPTATRTDPGSAQPQAAAVGQGPNGEVLTAEQQIRYAGLQERRAINDAELLANRAADRQAKQTKLDKMRAAQDTNLTPLQRQKKDIARDAKDLRVKSAQSQHDQLTLAQRDATRAKLDADPKASFRTGASKPTTDSVAATTTADPGNKQAKTPPAKPTATVVRKAPAPAPTPTTPVSRQT